MCQLTSKFIKNENQIVNKLKNESEMNAKNVIFLILLLKSCLLFGQQLTAQKRILIDVGHGGKDSGAIGINGVYEKDVVLNIAKQIVELNKSVMDSNFDIYLTRYTDVFVSLGDRSRLGQALEADVFVSLHCNAAAFSSKGIEVFVHKVDKTYTQASIALAWSVLEENSNKLGIKKRGIKFANFQVLRDMTSYCPSLLIEVGFITNTTEANYLSKPNNTRAVAMAILMGINKNLKNKL